MQNGIFSLRLLEAMKRRELTQNELSKETGITQAAISRYLGDKNQPRATELCLLSKSLGVTMDWLWGESEEKIETLSEDYWKGKLRDAETRVKIAVSALEGALKEIRGGNR